MEILKGLQQCGVSKDFISITPESILCINLLDSIPLENTVGCLVDEYFYEILDGIEIIKKLYNFPICYLILDESDHEFNKRLEYEIENYEGLKIIKVVDNYLFCDLEYLKVSLKIKLREDVKNYHIMSLESILDIYNIFENYKPKIETYLKFSGDIEDRRCLRVPIGIKIRDLLEGKEVEEDLEVIINNPISGPIVSLDYIVDEFTRGVYLLKKTREICRIKRETFSILKKRVEGNCSQCGRCTQLCPRNRLGFNIEPHKIIKNIIRGKSGIEILGSLNCSQCNLCSVYSCQSNINPSILILEIKKQLEDELKNKKEIPLERELKTDSRLIRKDKILQKLNLLSLDRKNLKIHSLDIKKKRVYKKLKEKNDYIATPIVKKGDFIKKYEKIALTTDSYFGKNLFAPCNGFVKRVTSEVIIIQSEE